MLGLNTRPMPDRYRLCLENLLSQHRDHIIAHLVAHFRSFSFTSVDHFYSWSIRSAFACVIRSSAHSPPTDAVRRYVIGLSTLSTHWHCVPVCNWFGHTLHPLTLCCMWFVRPHTLHPLMLCVCMWLIHQYTLTLCPACLQVSLGGCVQRTLTTAPRCLVRTQQYVLTKPMATSASVPTVSLFGKYICSARSDRYFIC